MQLLIGALALQGFGTPPEPPPLAPDPVPSVLILELGEAPRVIDSGRGGTRNKVSDYEGQDPRFAQFAEVIATSPGVVAAGHREFAFPTRGQLWREVLACRAPEGILGDAAPERICFACSIDDVGGLDFGGDKMSPTAISIRAAYAFFRRDDQGRWTLARYEPFGGNRYARNGEPRHRASARWIREEAVTECYDLQAVSGYMSIY